MEILNQLKPMARQSELKADTLAPTAAREAVPALIAADQAVAVAREDQDPMEAPELVDPAARLQRIFM